MKTFSDTAYLVLIDIDPEDLRTWKEIENMRGIKIGFTMKDRPEKKVLN